MASMAQTPTVRLAKRLPGNVKVAHKTGTNAVAFNDVGFVTLPDGRVLAVAAYTKSLDATDAQREEAMARIVERIYQAYTAESSAPHGP
jgi:beta-lactamase class A